MRLALVKKRFSPHGGAEQYLLTLIEQLKNAGHEIHLFCEQWTEDREMTLHRVNVCNFSSFLSVTTFNRNVEKALKGTSGFDCIISFERTDCQDVYRAGEGCHAEWLEIRSKTEPFYKRLSFLLNPLHRSLLAIERSLFSRTSLIIANSGMVKDNIMKHYAVPENRIIIIYNGVDLARFKPGSGDTWRGDVRRRFTLPEDTKVVLFVGSGFRRKGLGTAIEAVALTKREDIRLLVIGKGDAERFKRLAEKRGVSDRIVFTGPQKRTEEFYAAADLFVLPTLYDPFSNATLEAMAAGVPVITTKNNGVAELIKDGKEGFIVDDPFDAQAVARAINLSLEDPLKAGQQARRKAEEFPIERAAREFIESIRQVCQEHERTQSVQAV